MMRFKFARQHFGDRMSPKCCHQKREDLQCWRAISILAVLLFYIWPEKFPNGFLGVDM